MEYGAFAYFEADISTTSWPRGFGTFGIKPSCLQPAAYQVTSTLPPDACSLGWPRLKLEAGSARAWDSKLICLSGTQQDPMRPRPQWRCWIWVCNGFGQASFSICHLFKAKTSMVSQQRTLHPTSTPKLQSATCTELFCGHPLREDPATDRPEVKLASLPGRFGPQVAAKSEAAEASCVLKLGAGVFSVSKAGNIPHESSRTDCANSFQASRSNPHPLSRGRDVLLLQLLFAVPRRRRLTNTSD